MSVHRGSGITRWEEEEVQGTHEDVRKAVRRVADWATFEGLVRSFEAEARSILTQTGADPDKPTSKSFSEDSDGDYAARILIHIHAAREAIERGDAERAAHCGIKIGSLISEFNIKAEWEKPALSGKAALDGAIKGAKLGAMKRRQQKEAQAVKLAAEYKSARAKRKNISNTALKEMIGKKYDVPRSTSIELIDLGLEILSGIPPSSDD